MTGVDGQLIVGLAVPALGVVVWLIRLEGRINTNEALQKVIHENVNYIRERVDELIGGKR